MEGNDMASPAAITPRASARARQLHGCAPAGPAHPASWRQVIVMDALSTALWTTRPFALRCARFCRTNWRLAWP